MTALKKWTVCLLLAILLQFGFMGVGIHSQDAAKAAPQYDQVLYFPLSRYPETGNHIKDAISAGHSNICTIDRDGADERRKESLKGVPAKTGYDRDEWPMAVCSEGGAGADIRYVTPADNRGAGSWVGNQMSGYSDGTKVLFIVQ
ncbi:sporulation protein [Bacillus nakamurai]|uniref:NucA/NucB deoxyribonuclease domain-containing protein n=1 Tax=Bacillus nakamurai TaxID=1793963 RepID=UPI0007785D51|nr:sporulation protein [Bacillus nakamurai]